MVGAAVLVHIPHGIFAADGGWELVGSIAALLLVLAAAGPGRWSVDHSVRTRQGSVPALGSRSRRRRQRPPASAASPQLPASSDDSPSSAPTVTNVSLPARSTDPLSIHRRRSPNSALPTPTARDRACWNGSARAGLPGGVVRAADRVDPAP